MIGSTISHYRVLEKLGEGGMGVVYKAEDTKLDRQVALKFLPAHLASSEQDKARFQQEARAAAALDHPNICTMYGIDEHDGQMFLAMAYVEGQTLRDKMSSLNLKQGIEIGIQIAEGLAAAHEKGIVHRDIKPENIMIRKDGIVQIMDFGLAKLRASNSKVTRLTREGSTVGTAGYMSPEQVQGQDADHRSDIFSLGALLYELCTGQLPFKGVHETALLYEIVNVDAAPMSSLKTDIDPELDRIVLECLDKDPNERTQSAKQVSIDLRRFKRESSRQRMSRITTAQPAYQPTGAMEGKPLGPTRPGLKGMLPWVVAGLMAIIALVVFWAPWRSLSPPPVTRFSLDLPKEIPLDLGVFRSVAVSPDGSRIVYRANGRLYLRHMTRLDAVELPETKDASSPFFSPDGRWIGFFSGGKLRKMLLSGGAPVVLAEALDNRGATWGSDGSIVFSPTVDVGLARISDAGGQVQYITVPDSTRHERTHRWPHFLPDGKHVLYTVGVLESPDYYEDAVIEVVNTETGERKELIREASSAQYAESGHLLYTRNGFLFAVPFDAQSLEVTGKVIPVVNGIGGDATSGAMHYAFSSNGTLCYIPGLISGHDRHLALVDHSGKATLLAAPPQPYIEPRFSPDGKRIAVVVGAGKDYDVWVYDIERGTLNRLTFGGTNRTPFWSPDGKYIALAMSQPPLDGIVLKRADGIGQPELLLGGWGFITDWAPGGGELVLDWRDPKRGAASDIVILPVSQKDKNWFFLDTRFDEWEGSISPDGKWIAYITNESGRYEVYVQPLRTQGGSDAGGVTGKWQISTEGGAEPRWAPDGKTLYFTNNIRQLMMAVSVTTTPTFSAGRPKVLFDGYRVPSVESGMTYDLSPDGKYFLTTQAAEGQDASQQVLIVLNWFSELNASMNVEEQAGK